MRRHLAALGPHTSHSNHIEEIEVSDREEVLSVLTFEPGEELALLQLHIVGIRVWAHICCAASALGKAPNILSFVVHDQSP